MSAFPAFLRALMYASLSFSISSRSTLVLRSSNMSQWDFEVLISARLNVIGFPSFSRVPNSEQDLHCQVSGSSAS